MIKVSKTKMLKVMMSLMAVSSAFWLNSEVSAYTVSFEGGITIDFGTVTIPPSLDLNVGQQTITLDGAIDLPFTREQILFSLADGDSSIPIDPLFSRLFPQELDINGQPIQLNDIDITTFTGLGSVSSADGFLTNFNFEYIASDPVLMIPVVEITEFNPSLSQCVDIKCQYAIPTAILTASFDATLINSITTADFSVANINFPIDVTDAPVTASVSAAAVPESSAWFVVPLIFGGVVLQKWLCKDNIS